MTQHIALPLPRSVPKRETLTRNGMLTGLLFWRAMQHEWWKQVRKHCKKGKRSSSSAVRAVQHCPQAQFAHDDRDRCPNDSSNGLAETERAAIERCDVTDGGPPIRARCNLFSTKNSARRKPRCGRSAICRGRFGEARREWRIREIKKRSAP